MSSPKEQIQQLLGEHGFVLVRQLNHKIYKNPEGKLFVMSSTPSDRRAFLNALSDLKRVIGGDLLLQSQMIHNQVRELELQAKMTHFKVLATMERIDEQVEIAEARAPKRKISTAEARRQKQARDRGRDSAGLTPKATRTLKEQLMPFVEWAQQAAKELESK